MYPKKTTGKIIVVCILIFMLLHSNAKATDFVLNDLRHLLILIIS